MKLPEYVQPIKVGEEFSFSCHSGVDCFTECCRMLELSLTPYDVLRLRRATGFSSSKLLDEYIIEEQDVAEPFPRFYLTMVDDGRASCVFVGKDGCTVYSNRPAACRTYPLGRAVMRLKGRETQEHHVLMKETHCHGFSEPVKQTIHSYSKDQGLTEYNAVNDQMALILQHESIRQGVIPSQSQISFFRLALYDLDRFRNCLLNGDFSEFLNEDEDPTNMSDETLLDLGMDMVKQVLFSAVPTLTSDKG